MNSERAAFHCLSSAGIKDAPPLPTDMNLTMAKMHNLKSQSRSLKSRHQDRRKETVVRESLAVEKVQGSRD